MVASNGKAPGMLNQPKNKAPFKAPGVKKLEIKEKNHKVDVIKPLFKGNKDNKAPFKVK